MAREAGVSTATVSRALAAPASVSEELRRRVLETVERLGYTPNAAARNLRGGRSQMILVVVPRRANPPFFAEVLRGIDTVLSAAGYSVIMGNLDQEGAKERHVVEMMAAGHIDGAIILSGKVPVSGERSMLDTGLPMVSICAAAEGTHAILTDEGETIVEAARHLVGLGHRDLFYVAGPDGNANERIRWAALQQLFAELALGDVRVRRTEGNFQFSGGVTAAEAFLALAERPTGVVCCNDEMAIGFMKTVQAAGVRVPADVSVVGFDGIEFADFCEPTLTTVCQPRYELGATGARLMLDLIKKPGPSAPTTTLLANEFKVRDSTAPPRQPRPGEAPAKAAPGDAKPALVPLTIS
ncbi:LacI family DNA-binding transcriptional regulator [Aureimonas glaciei]|uniref:DNA-binding transcriptional regulator CytR n=1 Tax=Aureimonas glaciei TaxID=1776957 RepID=A0A916Y5Y4_9HYPH|nr:LacI family DNA-binding transcriptional regulator [Aureimonas glaciei]GGD32154.1 DNA-binding transcriptional regulator CytR [Aureimonas glaciei]